ncbi:hypothetical protein ACUXTG_001831 [Staphylococcus capitis]|nr:hypothetical protein [Staphylococcus capitis]MCK6221244.1 hypothetical protein [Staphylococcus capitis]
MIIVLISIKTTVKPLIKPSCIYPVEKVTTAKMNQSNNAKICIIADTILHTKLLKNPNIKAGKALTNRVTIAVNICQGRHN